MCFVCYCCCCWGGSFVRSSRIGKSRSGARPSSSRRSCGRRRSLRGSRCRPREGSSRRGRITTYVSSRFVTLTPPSASETKLLPVCVCVCVHFGKAMMEKRNKVLCCMVGGAVFRFDRESHIICLVIEDDVDAMFLL